MDDMYLFKNQDEGNRLLYAYYKGEFWFYDPNVQQWYISGHVREQYELAAQKEDGLTPDDFTCTGYGYEFVAEYEVPVAVLDALRAAKKVLPPEPASAEPPEIVDEGSGPEDDCPPPNPTDAGADAPPCAPTASDAQTLPYPNADAGAKTDGNGDCAACTCAGCKRSDCTCAGGHDVLGRADCDGRCNCSQSGCTYAIRHPENPTAAAPASLEAKDMNVPTFDYSELDAQTEADHQLGEREVSSGKRMAEIGLRRMADGVAIAHDALCGSCDNLSQLKHGNRGDET